jgi:hypothetical protein
MKNNDDIPTTDTNEIKQLINRVKQGDKSDKPILTPATETGLAARLFVCRFREESARLVKGEGVRSSPQNEDNTINSEFGQRVNYAPRHSGPADYKENRAQAFDPQEPRREPQRALANPNKLNRNDAEQDEGREHQRAAEDWRPKLAILGEPDCISEHANDAYRQPQQNKRLEPHVIHLFLSTSVVTGSRAYFKVAPGFLFPSRTAKRRIRASSTDCPTKETRHERPHAVDTRCP